MARIEFPRGFHWGTATAAYQIEGSPTADGKGESIWDRFAHTPDKIAKGDTGDVACDSYQRVADDIDLMRQMHCTSYRFSISWPRIQPTGRGAANRAGIDYYLRLVEDLLAAGIRPLPTLYHWDLPQALEDAGGWPERDTAGRFADYAEIMARALGDRVDTWVLLNEPSIFATMGYLLGVHAPGRRDLDAFLRASHTANLAQAAAFRSMKACRSSLQLGTAFNLMACEPASDSDEDAAAALRWHGLMNDWYLKPALHGSYPEVFGDSLPAERMGVQADDMERVRAPLDWIGVNLYTRGLIAADPKAPLGLGAMITDQGGGPDGPRTDFDWEVWPDALYQILLRIHGDYKVGDTGPIIEVTENGCSYGDGPGPDGRIQDQERIRFYQGYLAATARAIAEGVDVRGYHAWSLLDNFEWAEGYQQRFGLAWVDFQTGKRTLKESGRWYGQVAADNGFEYR